MKLKFKPTKLRRSASKKQKYLSTVAPTHALISIDLRPSFRGTMQFTTIDGQTHIYRLDLESMSPNIKFDKWAMVAEYKYTINSRKGNESS